MDIENKNNNESSNQDVTFEKCMPKSGGSCFQKNNGYFLFQHFFWNSKTCSQIDLFTFIKSVILIIIESFHNWQM